MLVYKIVFGVLHAKSGKIFSQEVVFSYLVTKRLYSNSRQTFLCSYKRAH